MSQLPSLTPIVRDQGELNLEGKLTPSTSVCAKPILGLRKTPHPRAKKVASRGESGLRRTVACRASYRLSGFDTAATPRLSLEEEGAKLPSKMIQCVHRQPLMPTRVSAESKAKTYFEQVLKTNEEEKNLRLPVHRKGNWKIDF